MCCCVLLVFKITILSWQVYFWPTFLSNTCLLWIGSKCKIFHENESITLLYCNNMPSNGYLDIASVLTKWQNMCSMPLVFRKYVSINLLSKGIWKARKFIVLKNFREINLLTLHCICKFFSRNYSSNRFFLTIIP